MFELSLDFTGIPSDSPWAFAWWALVHGGWVVVVFVFLWAAWTAWVNSRRHKFLHSLEYVLLAIDVPRETEQSPQAVEQIFSTVSGAYNSFTLWDRFWHGKHQESISFELVSLGGYIQYLVRTPVYWRDLLEAAIYAQYPDAEITAVEDYVGRLPSNFDTETHDLWGTEFQLVKKDVYPIRTYPDFEHTLSGDFKDPMASLLEVLGRIGADEDIWLQWVLTPVKGAWTERSLAEVQRLVKREHGSSHGILYFLFVELPTQTLCTIVEILFAGIIEPTWCAGYSGLSESEQQELVSEVMKLTPGERTIVEAIERKASKIGFLTKFRLVYWGRRETFLKGRGVSAVVGAIQQFSTHNLNEWKPGKRVTTQVAYFFKQSRLDHKRRSILRSFKARSTHRGLGHGVILNTEELATMYHFPVVTVKAPLVKKTEVKKAEPPFVLPVMGRGYLRPVSAPEPQVSAEEAKGAPPGNLPFLE